MRLLFLDSSKATELRALARRHISAAAVLGASLLTFAVNQTGRALASRRRNKAELTDPTLPALLEFKRPSTAITNAPVPRLARNIGLVVSGLVASQLLLMSVIPVDQVITTRGLLVTLTPPIVMQPLDTAIVRLINVRPGERVAKGTLLAQLDPTFTGADVAAMRAQFASIEAEVRRLQAEANGQAFEDDGSGPEMTLQASIHARWQAEYQLRMETYRQKIDEANAVISRAQSDADGYRERLKVAERVEGMKKGLEAKKLGSRLNTLAASDARAEMARSLANSEHTAEGARRDLAAMTAERDAYVQNVSGAAAQKLSESSRKLTDVREQLSKAERRHDLVELRAEQDSIVQSVAKVSPGSVLQSGQPLITLVPADAQLEVEASIPGRYNGFVHIADPVTVKFDTFPYAQYGNAQGSVEIISPDSFTVIEEERNPTGSHPVLANASEPFYRARISLTNIGLHGLPHGFALTPGMPVTADIKVGERTVLAYLMSKVVPLTSEGMREP